MFNKEVIMRTCVVVLIAVTLSACPLRASEGAAVFLSQTGSPASVGLGGAYTTSAQGVDAIYWNPAGLANGLGTQVSLATHQKIETRFVHFGVSKSDSNWGLGIFYGGAQFDGVQETMTMSSESQTRYKWTGKNLGYTGQALLIGSGLKVTETLSVGLTLKGIQETIATMQSTIWGVDVGSTFKITDNLAFSAVVQNLIQPSTLDTMARTAIVGTQLKPVPNLSINAEIKGTTKGSEIQAGAELEIHPQLLLRAGANALEWAVGTGIKLEGFSIDCAYSQNNESVVEGAFHLGIKLKL